MPVLIYRRKRKALLQGFLSRRRIYNTDCFYSRFEAQALESGTCDVVAVSPPGTFADIFTSAFEFAGTVSGTPVVSDMTYRGKTAVGGKINAHLILSNGMTGVLSVDSIVAEGGSYKGFLVITN